LQNQTDHAASAPQFLGFSDNKSFHLPKLPKQFGNEHRRRFPQPDARVPARGFLE
jgi:hypothetical protein